MNFKRSIKKHRRLAGSLSLLLCVAAIFLVVCSPLAVRASATTRKLPVYCVQRDDKCVSLTFDAAWGDVILRHGGFDEASGGSVGPVRGFFVFFNISLSKSGNIWYNQTQKADCTASDIMEEMENGRKNKEISTVIGRCFNHRLHGGHHDRRSQICGKAAQ